MNKLENVGHIYQLAMGKIAWAYAPVQRFVRNPYFPRNIRNCYGDHTIKIGRNIDEFDTARRMHLLKRNDEVLTTFDPHEAKQLALIKPTPICFGGLYILPSQIETNEDKSILYEELKRKIARFAFTLAVIEVMNSQIGLLRPVFSKLTEEMQAKAGSMSYEDYKEYLTNDFFKKYPEPIDYVKYYIQKTGEEDILKFVSYDNVEEIVDQELMSRYRQLEQYETKEAALVNLLDSILADEEFIIQAPKGQKTGQVEKQIGNVSSEDGGPEFIESVAQRLHLRHSRIPIECQSNDLFNGTIKGLIGETLAKYSEVTGVKI